MSEADIKEEMDLRLEQQLIADFGVSSAPGIDPGNTDGVIVSLTTHKQRLKSVYITIESIFQQTQKPKRIILWLDNSEFNASDIPTQLHKACDRGLEIQYCHNLRSYNKIIHTLRLHPEEKILTIDDDILYPNNLIESLVETSNANPDCIVAMRAHKISFNQNNEVLAYNEWESCISNTAPSFDTFVTGVGGALYPPGSLDTEVLNEETFMAICPTADDIWLKAMSIIKGTKSVVVPGDNSWSDLPPFIRNTQQDCLAMSNVDNANNTQLTAVFDKYNVWKYIKRHH